MGHATQVVMAAILHAKEHVIPDATEDVMLLVIVPVRIFAHTLALVVVLLLVADQIQGVTLA